MTIKPVDSISKQPRLVTAQGNLRPRIMQCISTECPMRGKAHEDFVQFMFITFSDMIVSVHGRLFFIEINQCSTIYSKIIELKSARCAIDHDVAHLRSKTLLDYEWIGRSPVPISDKTSYCKISHKVSKPVGFVDWITGSTSFALGTAQQENTC